MNTQNSTILKAISAAGSTAIIAILFFYFLTNHFELQKETNAVLREEIKTRQELIDTIDRLNRTISNKTVQANLYAAFNNRDNYDYGELPAILENGWERVKTPFPYEIDLNR